MQPKELFERASEWAGEKIAGVKDFSASTPCTDWDAKTVINHITGAHVIIARAARGEEPDASTMTADFVGDDPASAFRSAREEMLKDLKGAALDAKWKLPFGEMPAERALAIFGVDQLVHGWDIAKGTGQDAEIPAELVSSAYGVVNGNIPDEGRGDGGFFGPRVEVGEDASEQDKLLGYLGRKS